MRLKKYSLYILFPGCILVGLGLGVKWAAASAQPSVASAKGADPSSGKASTIAKAAMEDKMEDKPEKAATTPLSAASSEKNGENAIAVAPPPFSEGIFPCSACHDEKESVNTTPRPLSFHDDIVLKHDEKNRWCLDCHDTKNRDRLHLASGRPIEFGESYKLCGQCHGTKLRDWKAGEHGKRTGSWSGRKEYLLCAHCHNPHAPSFKPLKPLPAPQWPEGLQ